MFRAQMPPLPLIGRDEEKDWLARHLSAALCGQEGRALLLMGEAGIGKTHLLTHAIPSDRVLSQVTFPQARFAAPGSGLRKLAEIGGAAGRALEAELEETDDAVGGWKLLSICRKTDELISSSPGKIVIFDDLQWADELTLAWLSRSGDLLRESQTVVVLAVRGSGNVPLRILDATAPLRRGGNLHSLELGPLSAPQVGKLAELFGFELNDELMTTLHRRTDGLPLAAEELLREAARRGTDLQTIENLEEIGISTSLSVLAAMVREQTSSLDQDTQELLSAVALMPQPAEEPITQQVTGLDRERFDLALEGALTSGFLARVSSGSLRFRHELQREAFQAHLGIARRRSLHRRIATSLMDGSRYPAGKIAEQFVQAGLVGKALEWLERASIEAARAHDHGNALTHLTAAMDLCPPEDSEKRTVLAERAVLAARSSNQPSAGIELVEKALSPTTEPRQRGRLFLCLARLVSFFGDNDARAAALKDARTEFARAGDDAGTARVLGEIALPTGTAPSITERIALGRMGLALAERAEDPAAISLCAANLAVAELRSGNPESFALWARAIEVYQSDSSSEGGEEIVRNRTNWVIGALDYGLYPEAETVLREGGGLWANPFWKEFSHCLRAMYLWRVGRWDEAVDQAVLARAALSRPEVGAIATAIQAAVDFERDARPDIEPLIKAVESLIELGDEQWGAVAHSILMRIRAARREPKPERGLPSLLNLILTSGVRTGWDDVLPTVAERDPARCRRTLAVLGDLKPLGKRADASSQFTRGILATHEGDQDAEELLVEAARLYERLPDPFFTAKALEAAADARVRAGKRAGETRYRAAEIYRDLGADRSLAGLLRRGGNSRALDGFRVPASQAHAGAPGLTPREREIAELARQGYTARAMAETLGISAVTVKKHLERVKAKLSVERKSDLVRLLSVDSSEP